MTHGDPNTEWIESYSYFGGAGQTLMVKAQAEPGLAPQRDQNGELVLDQNGELVLDQNGDVVLADYPDGTFSKVVFTPWESEHWDQNDTVEESDWYAARHEYDGEDVYWQKERRAAELALQHRNTPSKMVLDSLGRPFLGIEDLDGSTKYETKVVLDIRGFPSQIIDARGNLAEGRTHGILGQVLETTSADAGDRQVLTTILGEPLRAWDAKGQCARVTYDDLRRPVDTYVQPAVGSEILLSRTIYGESLANPHTTNHRGRVYRTYDGGGQATTPSFDFKGLPTSSELKLLLDPTAKNDWTSIANQSTIATMATAAAPSLESTTYTSSSTHDALGRVLTAISPDGSEVVYAYNERGALKTVDCKHRGAQSSTPVVAEITYDVRGRRESITYASNATTARLLWKGCDRIRHSDTPSACSQCGAEPRTIWSMVRSSQREHYENLPQPQSGNSVTDMSIAILTTPDDQAVELVFREPIVVGHKGEFLLFWRERAYRDRAHFGFVPEGVLASRLVDLLPGTTFDAKVEEEVGRRGTPEFGAWRGHSGAWTEYSDGLGPVIILLLKLTPRFLLELEYSLHGHDPTPWDPFSETSLLATLEGANLVSQDAPMG